MNRQVTQDENRSEWKRPAATRLDVSETRGGPFVFDSETFDNRGDPAGGPEPNPS